MTLLRQFFSSAFSWLILDEYVTCVPSHITLTTAHIIRYFASNCKLLRLNLSSQILLGIFSLRRAKNQRDLYSINQIFDKKSSVFCWRIRAAKRYGFWAISRFCFSSLSEFMTSVTSFSSTVIFSSSATFRSKNS